MRTIDHVRHSLREPPLGVHLLQEGVDLARRVGPTLGRYDTVITSEIPRALETALAMGYAVQGQSSTLGSLFRSDDEIDWTGGCHAVQQSLRAARPATMQATQTHAFYLRSIAASLAADGSALIVSHGGVIELGVVGLLPDLDYSAWGGGFSYCEGVRLTFDGSVCVDASPLRVPEALRIADPLRT